MTRAGKMMLAVSGCLLVSAVGARGSAAYATTAAAASRPSDDTPDLATKAMVENACSECHKFTQVSAQHKSAAQWETVVSQMVSMGAPVSDADAPRVVAYLATNYGPVGTGKAAPR